jgi:hypothetical protein
MKNAEKVLPFSKRYIIYQNHPYSQTTGRMKVLKFTVVILFLAAASSCSYKTCPTYSKIDAPVDLTASTQPVMEVTKAR